MKSWDPTLRMEVLIECENGTYRQMRQIVFVGKDGKAHHLPIRVQATPEGLRSEFKKLGVVQPCGDVRIFCGPEETDWVHRLIQETWPSVELGEGNLGSTSYNGAVGSVVLTDRYFRSIAKIGFHYFLTQFPDYIGHEPIFSDLREFILQEGQGVDYANKFVGKRGLPLLGEMLNPSVRPAGWRAHVLCAEAKRGECLAHVQMFLTEDWPAPAYTVRLAQNASSADCEAAGHAYLYYEEGPKGRFSGETIALGVTRMDFGPHRLHQWSNHLEMWKFSRPGVSSRNLGQKGPFPKHDTARLFQSRLAGWDPFGIHYPNDLFRSGLVSASFRVVDGPTAGGPRASRGRRTAQTARCKIL